MAFVDAGEVGIGDVAPAKRDIRLELLLVIRAMALATCKAHRVIIRISHLQTNIVFFIGVRDLRVVIDELPNSNLINLLVEASFEILLLLSLLLLRLRLLLQVELLEIKITHLVVILVGHREPGVAE